MERRKNDSVPKRTILVVDDEPGFRDMLKWHLDGIGGVDVATARDGEEAMKHAVKGNIFLVITDLTMPRLNGLELLEKIKEKNPQTEVVILTGFGSVETAVHAMKKGAADFILKPFDLKAFTKMVGKILGKVQEK
ncbi:MAG: hypothetical protein A2901_06585 [Elusimicrobia bacterium RIFCSPLOWO2_01_FULL_54_10]|nr:MAG: hypothetical protein A2901_06585 [Elusimicrobia bacterium RIFCSPLOWO2_01_FULL_54_10]